MHLKKFQIHMSLVEADTLPLEQLPVNGEILFVMDFWDGGAKEGCLFVGKKEKAYTMWEYIYPYATHDGDAHRQLLKHTDTPQTALKEIETFCQKRYDAELPFDFSQTPPETIRNFFA